MSSLRVRDSDLPERIALIQHPLDTSLTAVHGEGWNSWLVGRRSSWVSTIRMSHMMSHKGAHRTPARCPGKCEDQISSPHNRGCIAGEILKPTMMYTQAREQGSHVPVYMSSGGQDGDSPTPDEQLEAQILSGGGLISSGDPHVRCCGHIWPESLCFNRVIWTALRRVPMQH